MADQIIPPWVRPESPETIRLIDDATVAFQPSFGRGQTQRGIFADPRWGLRRRYRGLRSDEKAAILSALNEARGQFNLLRVTPHTPIRGSFATSELLTNNTFANGTTGWTCDADYTQSVSDRVLTAKRVAFTTAATFLQSSASFSIVQYAPYVLRVFVMQGRGAFPTGFKINDSPYFGTTSAGFGMKSQVFVGKSTTDVLAIQDVESTGLLTGDYLRIPYASYTRCALVDNAPNNLLQSASIDSASWTKTGLKAVSANTQIAPDLTTTAEVIGEDSSTGQHCIFQTGTRSSAAQDLEAHGVFGRLSGTRNVRLYIGSDGSNYAYCTFTLSGSGSAAAPVLNGTATNARAFIQSLGNGFYYVSVVAYCAASTSVFVEADIVNGAGAVSYTGDNASSLIATLVGGCVSGVPVRTSVNTSSAVSSGTTQSGSGLYTKGWPASTSGLLLTGDYFEINGELKQLTAPVSSDAAGLAYMQFRPSLAGAPADNDPIIVYEPFGRFIYPQGTREIENLFGVYSDCEMNLEEIYS